MRNIIKAQLRSLKKDKIVIGMALFVLFIAGVFIFDSVSEAAGATAGSMIVLENGAFIGVTGMLFLLVITGNVVGNDFMDKTLNYEILSGHSRKEVYFGRAVTALLTGVPLTLILVIFYPVIITLKYNWGEALEWEKALLCYGLMVIIFFRVVCELTFLTIVLKNVYLVYLIGFIFGYAQMLVNIIWQEKEGNGWMLAVTGCMGLFRLKREEMCYAAVTSLVGGVLFLILGYLYFRQDDLN